jgi:hypothetical protein
MPAKANRRRSLSGAPNSAHAARFDLCLLRFSAGYCQAEYTVADERKPHLRRRVAGILGGHHRGRAIALRRSEVKAEGTSGSEA